MRSAIVSAGVLLFCFAYAAVRYVVVGDVAADQLPVYVTNKAVSWAGLVLIALAVGARPIAGALPGAAWLRCDRRALGMTGLGLTAVHTAMSLTILSPAYFGKFYTGGGHMTLWAELSMGAGSVALVLLVWQGRVSAASAANEDRRAASQLRRVLGTGVLALTLAHVVCMGLPGWLAPGDWPGGMPPITLLSAAVALAGVVLGLLPRRDA